MLDSQGKKSKKINFRLSKSEKDTLKDKALQANLSLSAYLIEAGLRETNGRDDVPSPICRSIYAELGRMMHDINLAISQVDDVCEPEKSDIENSLRLLSQRLEKIQLLLVGTP